MRHNGTRERLLLQLVRDNPNRFGGPMMTIEKLERMARKADKISRELRFGLPRLTTVTARIERLTDPDFTGSEEHQLLMWSVDKGDRKRSLHHPFLFEFQRGLVKHFAKLYAIPLYCGDISSHAIDGSAGGVVRILHAQYGMELHVEDWEVIGMRAKEWFWSNPFPDWKGSRTIQWGGDFDLHEYDPAAWYFSGFDEYIGDRR